MFCRNCGEVILDTDITCPNCGFAAGTGMKYCAHCGSETPPGMMICEICGNAVSSIPSPDGSAFQQQPMPNFQQQPMQPNFQQPQQGFQQQFQQPPQPPVSPFQQPGAQQQQYRMPDPNAYGQQGYGQPGMYQQPNMNGQYYGAPGVTYKSKVSAGLLGIFLGTFGVHNFYLGYTSKAVVQLLLTVLSCGALCWIPMIWGLIEGIMLLTGSINQDGKGLPLKD